MASAVLSRQDSPLQTIFLLHFDLFLLPVTPCLQLPIKMIPAILAILHSTTYMLMHD
jgi:hypothetical protein